MDIKDQVREILRQSLGSNDNADLDNRYVVFNGPVHIGDVHVNVTIGSCDESKDENVERSSMYHGQASTSRSAILAALDAVPPYRR